MVASASVSQDAADDFALLNAWRGGDRTAGDVLFGRHFTSIYRFFRSKVDDVLAEDLTQATFLGCAHGRDRFERASSFRTYLFSIARNQLYMHFRKKSRTEAIFDDQSVSVADLGASPGTLAAARQEQRLLLSALRRIPVDFQITIELYYWEGLSTAELAAVLEVPEGTVRSRLTRAREHLARQIASLAASQQQYETTMNDFEHWARSLRALLGSEPSDETPPS
jgi:RNA polymerase sigma factor (sigma-70 family)